MKWKCRLLVDTTISLEWIVRLYHGWLMSLRFKVSKTTNRGWPKQAGHDSSEILFEVANYFFLPWINKFQWKVFFSFWSQDDNDDDDQIDWKEQPQFVRERKKGEEVFEILVRFEKGQEMIFCSKIDFSKARFSFGLENSIKWKQCWELFLFCLESDWAF